MFRTIGGIKVPKNTRSPQNNNGTRGKTKTAQKSKRGSGKTKNNQKNKKISEFDTEQSDIPMISASDIERFGYCPMSWWLKYTGLKVSNEKLEDGTKSHKKIITEVSSVKEKETFSKTSEFNLKLFAFIATVLALNAIAILISFQIIRNLLIYIAVVWIIFAMLYFIYNLLVSKTSKGKSFLQSIRSSIIIKNGDSPNNSIEKKQQGLLTSGPQIWKRSAIWFLIIASGLAFNGIAFLQPASPTIMSRIFLISALLWLIGTAVLLYFVLRYEEIQRNKSIEQSELIDKKVKRTINESEKLIIGFATVATLLAINGLTIQHRNAIVQYTYLGQIILFLAALWLGISFAFLYISFRGGLVTRRFARDLKSATTESKKYEIVMEEIKTPSIPDRIFSYNWPMLFTIIAFILGINSILIRYGTQTMGENSELLSRFLVIISLLWLLGAFIFLYDFLKNTELADEIRRLHGIYKGKIEYMDKLDDKSKILFSEKHRLQGKPDYIVKIKEKYIPVELKTGKIPRGPHFSHIVQIAAYCLLINERYNVRPPYGIISYGKENKHKITYDAKLQDLLIDKLEEMRTCIKNDVAHRNHNRWGKCQFCSRRAICPERL